MSGISGIVNTWISGLSYDTAFMLGLVWIFLICPIAAISCFYVPVAIARVENILACGAMALCLLIGYLVLNEHPLFWLHLPPLIYAVWYLVRGEALIAEQQKSKILRR